MDEKKLHIDLFEANDLVSMRSKKKVVFCTALANDFKSFFSIYSYGYCIHLCVLCRSEVDGGGAVVSSHLVVVAIDFGTTYSGYAFSFASDARAPAVRYVIPRLHDRANIQQMQSKYTCTTCAPIAGCLLDVCSTFAG